MKPINELLKTASEMGASDLHIKVGTPPVVRLYGHLAVIPSEERVAKDEAQALLEQVLSPAQHEVFKKKYDLDFAYSVPGLGRFRCNAFVQRGAVGLVFRVIPMVIPSFSELNLPKVLEKLTKEERGLILVTGTTGSGKSTTLASLIDSINSEKTFNIVTIEDPIEYLHRDKKSIINQREVGTDTLSFTGSLRAALRQDPDVILVGEMRDLETIEIAMTAAETGHLVMSTLHTVDAKETVNRIISVFPPHQQHQVRSQLSSIIKGIVSLRLLPRADGKGRVPAVEVLLATSLIKECIVETEKTKLITDVIAQGHTLYGMQTFDQSILGHFQSGIVTYEEALRWATNAEDFKLKVKGVHSTGEMVLEELHKGGPDEMEIERFTD